MFSTVQASATFSTVSEANVPYAPTVREGGDVPTSPFSAFGGEEECFCIKLGLPTSEKEEGEYEGVPSRRVASRVKKDFQSVPYTGEIPASLTHYFSRKYIYPVCIPEIGVFGKVNAGDKNYNGNIHFYLMGMCPSPEGPITKVTKEDWKNLTNYQFHTEGPYVKYRGVNSDEAYVPTLEEIEEAGQDICPLHNLVISLQNPPKNKLLANHEKKLAILVANTELELLGTIAGKQELFVSKWVSEDYIPDEDESENTEEEEEEKIVVDVPPVTFSHYGIEKGVLLLEKELEEMIKADLLVKEKRERRPINDRIRAVVVRTPQPMIKPPTSICEEETIAWKSLDEKTKEFIIEKLSISPAHAHYILSEILGEKKYYYYRSKYSTALTTLGKMMFYCLKRLRFGELCKEKTLEEASAAEKLPGGEGQKWKPVSQEERAILLSCISRMIHKTPNFYIGVDKTVSFLNQFLPFWNIPGVNFTGSICCFMSLQPNSYNVDTARFYTPTRFEIRLQDAFPDTKYYGYHNFKVYPLALYFPMEGTSEYFTQHLKRPVLNSMCREAKIIKEANLLKPEGEIDCPWACVVVSTDRSDVSLLLVRVLPNTDCDVPVFDHGELDNVALKVYSRVKRNGTIMERQERASGSHCWNISMSSRIPEEYASSPKLCTRYIKDYMNFYPIQLYRTREEHIWTHHVAMTRLYGKAVDGVPEFSVSPDQINSVIMNRSERYNYFAGKTTPLSILNKYKWRGFDAPHYIEKRFELQKEFIKENLPIPVGLVTTKFANWIKEANAPVPPM